MQLRAGNWQGVILKVEWSEKAGLTYKKACLVFPQLHLCIVHDYTKEMWRCVRGGELDKISNRPNN